MKITTITQILANVNLSYEEETQIVLNYCKQHNAHYYARPRESFSIDEGIREATKLGKAEVVVEDLS